MWKYTFETALGKVTVVGSTQGLRLLILPDWDINYRDECDTISKLPPPFQKFEERFQNYLSGQKVIFTEPLDISEATPFQQEVWKVTLTIPHGETRSYKWVATQAGKPTSFRAVGQALNRNPLPVIIPCHRVIASDGDLCGFGAGLEMKRFLLAVEQENDTR